MSNKALFLSLLTAASFTLGACSGESEPGQGHEAGGEHSHEDGSPHGDHGGERQADAPKTEAFYGDEGKADASAESGSEESHSHDEDAGSHSH